MKKALLFKFLIVVLVFASKTVYGQTNLLRYTKVNNGYLMVLKQGDNLFEELQKFAATEGIPSATFTGIGFVNIEFGYFNASKKQYTPKRYENIELAALIGSIAWQNGNPSLHAHGVGAGKDYKALAGHILSATVSTGSLEISIVVLDKKFERVKDEQIGANILELKD